MAKLKDKSPRGKVYVEAHHAKVRGRELGGQGNFEWSTDLIETKKLENYTRHVAQDLYSGEAQREPRRAHEEQHCRSPHETSGWIENAVARNEIWTSNVGWYEWLRLRAFEQGSSRAGVQIFSVPTVERMFTTTQLFHDDMISRLHQPQRVGALFSCHLGHQGTSVGPGQFPRCIDARKGKAVGSQKAPQTTTTRQEDSNTHTVAEPVR